MIEQSIGNVPRVDKGFQPVCVHFSCADLDMFSPRSKWTVRRIAAGC